MGPRFGLGGRPRPLWCGMIYSAVWGDVSRRSRSVISSSMVAAATGFVTKRRAPTLRLRFRSSALSAPDIAIMGRLGKSCRKISIAPSPSSSGITRSVITTWGRTRRQVSMPSLPFAATQTASPFSSSACRIVARNTGSSSIIRTLLRPSSALSRRPPSGKTLAPESISGSSDLMSRCVMPRLLTGGKALQRRIRLWRAPPPCSYIGPRCPSPTADSPSELHSEHDFGPTFTTGCARRLQIPGNLLARPQPPAERPFRNQSRFPSPLVAGCVPKMSRRSCVRSSRFT